MPAKKIYPPIEEVLRKGDGIEVGDYVCLYDMPVTLMKFKYGGGVLKNKYKPIRALGVIELKYSKKVDKFYLIFQACFRLPYYKRNAYVKFLINQRMLSDLINIRQQLRPFNSRDVKGITKARKLSPITLEEDRQLKAKMRAEREERQRKRREKRLQLIKEGKWRPYMKRYEI